MGLRAFFTGRFPQQRFGELDCSSFAVKKPSGKGCYPMFSAHRKPGSGLLVPCIVLAIGAVHVLQETARKKCVTLHSA